MCNRSLRITSGDTMNLNNNRTNKNQNNNQKLEINPSEKENVGQFISYYDHHKKRQFTLAKRRNKAALNSIFYSFNL